MGDPAFGDVVGCLQDAYTDVLERHHLWIVRKAVQVNETTVRDIVRTVHMAVFVG